MNKRNMGIHLCTRVEEWLDTLPSHITMRVKDKVIVTGGALVSLMNREEVNDYDVYLADIETAKVLGDYYAGMAGCGCVIKNDRLNILVGGDGYKELTKPEEKKVFKPLFITGNAVTLSDNFQIILRFQGSPQEIHSNFDFIHCTNHYEHWNREVVINPLALESIVSKELQYVGSKYPLASIMRTRKFIKRGWTCNAGQYLKMAMQVNEFDLTDREVLKDQLMGVDATYFNQMFMHLNVDNVKLDKTYLFEVINKFF